MSAEGHSQDHLVGSGCRPWWRSPTLWFVVLAAAYALPSLTFPFGRDQALHHYIGREWLDGMLPYRDSFDHKPPLVFGVHAALIYLFGPTQVAIRILDLIATVLSGILVAVAVRRDHPLRRGELGLLVLVSVTFYYTCFDYWDTAQQEHFEGILLLGAYLGALRVTRLRWAATISGALSAMAVLFKLPAVLPALGIGAVLAVRARCAGGGHLNRYRRLLSVIVLHVLAGSAVLAIPAAYFAWHGALYDLWDGLFLFSLEYVRSWATPMHQGIGNTVRMWIVENGWWTVTLMLASAGGTVSAIRRRAWPVIGGIASAGLLFVLTLGSVFWQQKFWPYHWVVAAPFLVLCAAYGVAEGMRRRPSVTTILTLSCVGIGITLAGPWQSHLAAETSEPSTYPAMAWKGIRYACGDLSRDEFLRSFVGCYGYSYRDQEIIALEVRRRAHPHDRLVVTGFEPAIYTVSGLSCPSRFAADHFIYSSDYSHSRERWKAEHEIALRMDPPRFVVCRFWEEDYVVRRRAVGYEQVYDQGSFLLFERPPGPGP